MSNLRLHSVSSIVAAGQSVLPTELVSPANFTRLQALAHFLPDSVIVGLECRLSAQEEPVDLWICPGIEPAELQPAAAWLHNIAWPDFAPLSACLERGEPPWSCAHGAWTTEFDLARWDSTASAPPLPSSFVTFGSAKPALDIEASVERLWQGERGEDMPNSARQQLRNLIKRCPQGELAGWGFLYPRSQQPARLMLRVTDLADLAELLGDNYPAAQRLLEGLTFQVVIGTALNPESEKRQSLEAYLQGAESWQELTRRLVAQGYSTPTKAQALLNMALSPQMTPEVIGTLNHIKMALYDDGHAEVKAYPSLFLRV